MAPDAKGRLIVKELVVVEILKIFPAVPVAKAPALKEVVMAVEPEPVTAPERVILWFPVK